jgi:hypothetical protein
MAVRKVISKLTHNEANVKVYGAAADTATIDLVTDLALASDIISGLGIQKVEINKILWSTAPVAGSSITLTRGGVVIAALFGSGEMNLNAMGMTEDDLDTAALVVTMVGTAGTIYLKLKKTNGYGD